MSQYGAPTPPPPPPSTGGPTSGGKGFFGALFDFRFETFITPMIVKAVYVLATVLVGLGYLLFLVTSFTQSASAGIVVLVLGPILALVYLAFIRMTLEFYLAIVRMSEDIHRRQL